MYIYRHKIIIIRVYTCMYNNSICSILGDAQCLTYPAFKNVPGNKKFDYIEGT